MMRFKSFIILFFYFFIWVNYAQEINLDKDEYLKIGTFYKNNFNVLDDIVLKNDTLYLKPILIQPKVIVLDTLIYNKSSSEKKYKILQYTIINQQEVQNFSEYLAPKEMQMIFEPSYTIQDKLPFDYIAEEIPYQTYWKKINNIGVDFNQISFLNWNAGGTNSISAIAKGEFVRTYEKGRTLWHNELKLRYGLNKQEQLEWRKTDDVFHINSAFGYRTSIDSRWYYTGKMTLQTQMDKGYNYPDVTQPISRFFAPAYLFTGIGAEYSSHNKALLLYLAPFTLKSTFVMDNNLADKGAFGVKPAIFDATGAIIEKSKNAKHEFGFLLSAHFKKELFKNMLLDTKWTFYSDYLHQFGNIDIDGQLLLEFTINQYFKANITGQLLYDDDIKNQKEINGETVIEGPKLQLKQSVGIGIMYTF